MKLFSFFTIIILVVCFTACSNGETSSLAEGENNIEAHDDNLEESKKIESWKEFDTVDDFGKATGETIIAAEFTGKMSNSATVNSPLRVIAQLSSEGQLYLSFREYERSPADMPNSKFMYIDIRRPNGDVDYAGQFLWNGYMVDGGYLPGSDPNYSKPEWRSLPTYGDGESRDNQLLDILLEETEPITVRVEMSRADRNNSAVYVFDMDNSGLRDLLQ